jgi:hypothetical protein
MTGLDRRLEKLESRYVTGERRAHWVDVMIRPWEPGAEERAEADRQAEIDKLIASGRASPSDDFRTIRRIIVRHEPRGSITPAAANRAERSARRRQQSLIKRVEILEEAAM